MKEGDANLPGMGQELKATGGHERNGAGEVSPSRGWTIGGSGVEEEESLKVEEAKKSLQKSVASYFDRLREEEREKRKKEREEQERKKRLPILLLVHKSPS